MTIVRLSAALSGNEWLATARARVAAEPSAVGVLLAAAGRNCGRTTLDGVPGWRCDDAARVLLLDALPLRGTALAAEVSAIYRQGDADEKRAVLLALPWLGVRTGCIDVLRDALRTNDARLVAAAMGPYARHLDDPAWRDGVLKCVFMGVPLAAVDRLNERADPELARMLGAFSEERRAAGRAMPGDAVALWDRLT